MVMVFIRVSHSCLFIKLGTLFNSVVATFGFKSCENHSLSKRHNGGNKEHTYLEGNVLPENRILPKD